MKKRKLVFMLLSLVILLAALIYDSNSRLTVTEYSVASEKLPRGFEGYTVAQLSDLHGLRLGLEEDILAAAAAAEPDIIAITGDMVDENTDMERVEDFLSELCSVAPVYFVSGNHEWASGRVDKLKGLIKGEYESGAERMEAVARCLQKCGVHYLSNGYETLSRGEERIILAGVEDPNGPYDMIKPPELVENIRSEAGGDFLLLLGHRNYWAEKYPELDADIILCGHAHGGIVRLPLLGGVLGTGFELFPDHVDGAVDTGRYTMIVSRGLGNSVPLPRFLNNPEMVVLKLYGG